MQDAVFKWWFHSKISKLIWPAPTLLCRIVLIYIGGFSHAASQLGLKSGIWLSHSKIFNRGYFLLVSRHLPNKISNENIFHVNPQKLYNLHDNACTSCPVNIPCAQTPLTFNYFILLCIVTRLYSVTSDICFTFISRDLGWSAITWWRSRQAHFKVISLYVHK